MDRLRLTRLLALIAALAAVAPAGARASAPSVVVVMTDDETVGDLSAMPATRRLIAGRGVTFARSYASYPVCCPSRATFLTGRYAHNHGVMGLYPPSGGYGRLDKANTLPVWLRRSGYRTAHVGKFLNGYGDADPAEIPPGWGAWHAGVGYSAYRMWGYRLNDDGRLRTYGRPFSRNPRLYQTDVLTEHALSAIHRAGTRPLFLSLAYLAPHHEDRAIQRRSGRLVRPAPRHGGGPARLVPVRAASFNERDMSDKPRLLRRRPLLGRASLARVARDAASRRASLRAVDDGIARIVRALRAEGRLGDTYVLVTSDNGYMQGEHRVPAGKMLPYDPSSAVPLLVRGPGIPAGAVSHELVANVDLAPTILDIAGAAPSKPVDGRSLLPYAHRPDLRSGRPVLHETGGLRVVPGGVRRVRTWRAVRTRRWLWVAWRGGERELYDLRRDPDQVESLHADRRYRGTRRALARELRRLARCDGKGCNAPATRIPRPRRGPRRQV